MTQAATAAAQEELELAIEDGFVRIYGREVAECFYGRPVATAALSLEVLLSAIEQLLEVIQRSAADAEDLPKKVRDKLTLRERSSSRARHLGGFCRHRRCSQPVS